jgi:hypothetical protein
MLKSYSMSFDGSLLRRGFWLYVLDIRVGESRHLYVGRTGDSSSPHASSPFSRIGRHLDHRTTAKNNSLARQLGRIATNPPECSFQMVAIGPIFPEQDTFPAHVLHRDTVGALESALATTLRKRGYMVLGSHAPMPPPDSELFRQVLAIIDPKFPSTVV